jgi:hypothetical protein
MLKSKVFWLWIAAIGHILFVGVLLIQLGQYCPEVLFQDLIIGLSIGAGGCFFGVIVIVVMILKELTKSKRQSPGLV